MTAKVGMGLCLEGRVLTDGTWSCVHLLLWGLRLLVAALGVAKRARPVSRLTPPDPSWHVDVAGRLEAERECSEARCSTRSVAAVSW